MIIDMTIRLVVGPQQRLNIERKGRINWYPVGYVIEEEMLGAFGLLAVLNVIIEFISKNTIMPLDIYGCVHGLTPYQFGRCG